MSRRPILIVVALAALVAFATLPAIAADPSPSASVPPGRVDKPPNPGKGPKGPKVEKVAVTVSGTVAASTDADGRAVYTLRSGSTTWTLDGGPAWFYGDDHPLKAFVGKRVTVVGRHAAGSTELDVETVDGTTLREPGKPPWAGGWKVVGERHPGWSEEKAERFRAKFGDCFPPGKCKVKAGASAAP